MRKLRTKIEVMTVCFVLAAVILVSSFSLFFIRRSERHEIEQLLLLLCETGEKNLDYYFDNAQTAVGKVTSFVEQDLEGLETEQLEKHIEHVEEYFDEVANKTNGVTTYYYRINPEISDTVKGFWYTDLEGKGFEEHEVTDITGYDTDDTSGLVWFTVPKLTGKPVWLPPYVTDNLDMRVISYNVPVYWYGQFIGVIGIEIDCSTMAKQVESIRLYNSGYAFLSDAEGNLFFHPRMDVTELAEEDLLQVPEGLISDSTFIRYQYEGVEKQAAWLPLSNGMRLFVSVPVSEPEGSWTQLTLYILLTAAAVLLVLALIALFVGSRIEKPVDELTQNPEKEKTN